MTYLEWAAELCTLELDPLDDGGVHGNGHAPFWSSGRRSDPPIDCNNEAQLGKALRQVRDTGVIPTDQVRLCVVCDGASWIWKHVKRLFPRARQVLDYYHCKEYLHKVAKVHSASAEWALEWVEATLMRLYVGKVGWVWVS